MKLSKIQRAELKQKFNGHCAYCGELLGDKWHADHIEAVKRELEYVGGGVLRTTNEMLRPHNDTLENLNPACVPCNTNKSSMSLESWRQMLGHYRDVQLLRDSAHARHLHRFGLIEIKPNPVIFFFETYQGGGAQIANNIAKAIAAKGIVGGVQLEKLDSYVPMANRHDT